MFGSHKKNRSLNFAFAGLFALIGLIHPTNAYSESCPSVDDDAYTLYVYADTDAKVLLDQKCETITGESHLDKVIDGNAECRCYDKKVSDVLSTLTKAGGPIAIVTRKITTAVSGITCKLALKQCEEACIQTANSAPKACASIKTAGISIY